jgi:hypothetical protein
LTVSVNNGLQERYLPFLQTIIVSISVRVIQKSSISSNNPDPLAVNVKAGAPIEQYREKSVITNDRVGRRRPTCKLVNASRIKYLERALHDDLQAQVRMHLPLQVRFLGSWDNSVSSSIRVRVHFEVGHQILTISFISRSPRPMTTTNSGTGQEPERVGTAPAEIARFNSLSQFSCSFHLARLGQPRYCVG